MAKSNDEELSEAPGDGITKLCFSPTVPSLLLCSSWDKSVRLFDTLLNRTKFSYFHSEPVLDCVLDSNSKCISGGLDNTVMEFVFELVECLIGRVDVATERKNQLYAHEDAVKAISISESRRK